MEPWYNKKRIWQCQWILSAMSYQQYSLFLTIDAPLWSPMWVIPLFSTHEALIIYDNSLSPRYILSSTCWQSTQTLPDVWSTKVLLRESVNGVNSSLQAVAVKYVDLCDLLPTNLQAKEPGPQFLFHNCLVLMLQPKKLHWRIEGIAMGTEEFTIFSSILLSHFPHRWRYLL